MRVWIPGWMVLLVVSCAGSAVPDARLTSTGLAAAKGATRLPDFRLSTIDGDRFVLSNHVGRDVIVMSFWATWCMSCLAELPHLSALYEREKANGLVVVAVAIDDPHTQADVAPTARRLGLEMPVIIDEHQRAVRLYNRNKTAPMTVVIDRLGRIVRTHAGYNPGDETRLEAELQKLLAGS